MDAIAVEVSNDILTTSDIPDGYYDAEITRMVQQKGQTTYFGVEFRLGSGPAAGATLWGNFYFVEIDPEAVASGKKRGVAWTGKALLEACRITDTANLTSASFVGQSVRAGVRNEPDDRGVVKSRVKRVFPLARTQEAQTPADALNESDFTDE